MDSSKLEDPFITITMKEYENNFIFIIFIYILLKQTFGQNHDGTISLQMGKIWVNLNIIRMNILDIIPVTAVYVRHSVISSAQHGPPAAVDGFLLVNLVHPKNLCNL